MPGVAVIYKFTFNTPHNFLLLQTRAQQTCARNFEALFFKFLKVQLSRADEQYRTYNIKENTLFVAK